MRMAVLLALALCTEITSPDFIELIGDGVHQLGMALRMLADDEERRPDPGLVEPPEDPRSSSDGAQRGCASPKVNQEVASKLAAHPCWASSASNSSEGSSS